MSLRVVVSKILFPESEMYRMRKPAIGRQRADLRGFSPLTLRVSRWRSRSCGLHLTRSTWTDRASGQLVVVELWDFVAGSIPAIAARSRGADASDGCRMCQLANVSLVLCIHRGGKLLWFLYVSRCWVSITTEISAKRLSEVE